MKRGRCDHAPAALVLHTDIKPTTLATPHHQSHHLHGIMADTPVHANPNHSPARVSIYSLYARVLTTFARLQTELRRSDDHIKQQLPESALEDEVGRFRLWAGNNGAHRKGRVSLDHKLRYATHIHDKVTHFLRQLDGVLQSGIARILFSEIICRSNQ